jgi:hypothetical protein
VEIQLARLTTLCETRFADMDRRFDASDLRLESIETETKRTNGRVTRAEEQIRTLFRRGREVAHALTLADLKWYLAVAGGSIGGTYWALHVLGLLK